MARVKTTNSKPKLQTFTVTEYRTHQYTCKVKARTPEEALELAEEFVDLGLDFMEPSLIVVQDASGKQVYEEIP